MLIIIWKFRAKRGQEQTFEQAYGPDGAWVTLFRKGNGYLGTELLRSQDGSYVTIDRWNSQEAYAVFQNDHSSDYQLIDDRCTSLTDEETLIGTFFVV